jgi:hypothetical protein
MDPTAPNEEDAMSEPGTSGQQPADDQGSHASVGDDPAQPGAGRTESQTTVDEDMGPGEEPAG